MEVKIISKECIKPSPPTPLHLKTYNLSFLDQLASPNYFHAVLFYPIEDHRVISVQEKDYDDIEQRSILLKQSLSKTLSLFYPLAGKLRGDANHFIDCNDEGVYYAESRVGSNMLMFLGQPDNSMIKKFLPCNQFTSSDSMARGAHIVLVQANMFECGSIALGISIHHTLIDGVGMSVFLKCWSDIARGGSGAHNPDFTTAPTLFPKNDAFPKELSFGAMLYPFIKTGKVVAKRFVFDSSALAKLKVKATNSLCQNPTRVEVVSALIWKCAIKALRANSGIQRSSLLVHPMNLRRTTALPFSDNTMGNIISFAIVPQCQAKPEAEIELSQLVHEIQGAKAKILKDDLLKTLQGDKGFSNLCDTLKKMNDVFSSARNSSQGTDIFVITSWVNFGFYEVNFGWGKPVWVTSTTLSNEEVSPMLNFVILNDTRCGNGIEAWVTLDEQDMALFESDEQLLAFSSIDTSPLALRVGV